MGQVAYPYRMPPNPCQRRMLQRAIRAACPPLFLMLYRRNACAGRHTNTQPRGTTRLRPIHQHVCTICAVALPLPRDTHTIPSQALPGIARKPWTGARQGNTHRCGGVNPTATGLEHATNRLDVMKLARSSNERHAFRDWNRYLQCLPFRRCREDLGHM